MGARFDLVRHVLLTAMLVAACCLTVSCGDDNDSSSSGDSSNTGDGGGGGDGGGSGDGGGDPAASFSADVQPIFSAKCAPCHTTANSGGVNFATIYEDTQGDAFRCPGEKVYGCILIRIQNGQMPRFSGCTGDPALDIDNASCLTQEEQDRVSAWVDAGAPN